MKQLEIKNLHVNIEDKEIIKGVNLEIEKGEIVALMGPNGSGKSTLSYTIAGDPKYEVTQGEINFENENITELAPHKRAKKGIFLSFQYPEEIPGVTVFNLIRTARKNIIQEPPEEFLKILKEKMTLLNIPEIFAKRNVNEGFSGGEKKRNEILQMSMLNPKLAILDETDSGLDIDALKTVAEGINKIKTPETTILIITHYQRILKYIKPDKVYIMNQGKIIKQGTKELAEKIEKEGYDTIIK